MFSLKFVDAKIFKFGVYLAPSRIAKNTPSRPESLFLPESEVLSGTIESISSTKRKQVSQGIS